MSKRSASEYAEDAFESEWFDRMSPRERRMYRERRASRPMYGSDLSPSQWIEFARLRAASGEQAAHDFVTSVRLGRLREVKARAPSLTRERLNAVAFTAFGRTLAAMIFVLPATAFYGHVGFVASACVTTIVTVAACVEAWSSGKAS